MHENSYLVIIRSHDLEVYCIGKFLFIKKCFEKKFIMQFIIQISLYQIVITSKIVVCYWSLSLFGGPLSLCFVSTCN